MKLELHIDELILEGFDPADRFEIGQAIERELEHLLREQGAPDWLGDTRVTNRHVTHLDIDMLPGQSAVRPQDQGRSLATQLYSGLKSIASPQPHRSTAPLANPRTSSSSRTDFNK